MKQEDVKVLFSDLEDIPRLRAIAFEREFTRPVRVCLVNQVEAQLKRIAKLEAALIKIKENSIGYKPSACDISEIAEKALGD